MTSTWPRLCRAGALLLPLLAAQYAHAQYSWIDEKGTRVFSDRPPPPDTPPSRILKAPRPPSPYAQDVPATPAAATPAASAPSAAPLAKPQAPTLADREADYRKRAAQRDEDERKAAAEAERKAQAQEACQGARQVQAEMTSGRRVMRADANGEPEYLTDEERARQLDNARRVLAGCH